MTVTLSIGIITMYSQAEHIGQPLYCDRGQGRIYDPATVAPWIALPVTEYQSGRARCGDLVELRIGTSVIRAQALDAGPLHRYHIASHPNQPIIADVPQHLWPASGISHPGNLINLSALERHYQDSPLIP